MTDHPLTETAAAELWDASRDPGCPLTDRYEEMRYGEWAVVEAALRAAFDAGREHEREHVRPAEVTEEMRRAAASAYEDMAQVTRPENHEKCLNAALSAALAVATPADPRHDPHPWEPLSGPVRVGDEVRQELNGVTTIAVVGRVDGEGDPWTAEDRFIGVHDEGTWYVRRAIQELPTEDGVEIVPAGGGPIGAAHPGGKFTTHHATYDSYLGSWVGVWRAASGRVTVSSVSPGDITPGTWKVEGE